MDPATWHDGIPDEIAALYNEDQKDRSERLYEKDAELFIERDKKRLAHAEILLTFKDRLSLERLCDLAILFQHGGDPAHYRTAWELARHAADAGYDDAKWITAVAEDRYLLSIGQKQKWGTQFHKNERGEWELRALASDEESGITDDMRVAHHVAPRAEQLEAFLRHKA